MPFQARDLMLNVLPTAGDDAPNWRLCVPISMIPTTGDDEKEPEQPECQAVSCADNSAQPEPGEAKYFASLATLREELRQALLS